MNDKSDIDGEYDMWITSILGQYSTKAPKSSTLNALSTYTSVIWLPKSPNSSNPLFVISSSIKI